MAWDFGQSVKQVREAQGMRQVDLAQAVGVGDTYISAIEHGDHDPSAWLLRKLCLALDISADVLLALPATATERQAELARMREGPRLS